MDLKVFGADTVDPQILFPIIYETEENYIDLTTIVRAAHGVEETFRGTNIALYGLSDEVELIFGTSDPGSVRKWVGKKAKQGIVISTGFAATQFADGFLETATGKTFQEWGSIAAEYSIQAPELAKELVQKQIQKQLLETEVCRKLLEAEEDEIDSILSERPDASAAVQKGRRLFYESCRANEKVPSVRFGLSPNALQIRRSKFSERAKRLSIDPGISAVPIVGKWRTAILKIEVTSPNWDRLDQQRGWKGILSNGKHIYFHISDSTFWRKVAERTLRAETPDVVVAQMIFEDVNGRYKNADAIKIIQFNDASISEVAPEERVALRLKEYQDVDLQIEKPLFDIED